MLRSTMDFFQYSPLAMWVLEVHTNRFLDANETAVACYGYSREEFLTMDVNALGEAPIQTSLGENIYQHKKKNGEILYVQQLTQQVQYEGHAAKLFIISDFTKSVEIERRMQQSTERFNIVSKATSDTIWDLSLESKLITWNRGIKGVFKHMDILDHVTSIDWWKNNIHQEDRERVLKNIERHIDGKIGRWKDEYRFRCGDGSYRYVLDRGFLIFDEQGDPVRLIGALDDITERKVYIKAIEDQNKKFKEIAWIQSHMVRAPLARIMALVDLIKVEPEDDDCEVMLDHLSSSAKELDAVIIDMAYKTPLN